MARSFATGAATDRINFGTNTPTTLMSFSYWMNPNARDATPRRVWDWTTNGNSQFSNTLFTFGQFWSGSTATWQLTAPPSTGSLTNIVITYDGSSTLNNPTVYYNNVSQGLSNTTAPVGTILTSGAVLVLGNRETPDQFRSFDGSLAEFGRWNRLLLAGETALLAAGYSPLFFPDGLVFYSRLLGSGSSEPDIIGAQYGTVTGATAATHPAIIMPNSLASLGAGT